MPSTKTNCEMKQYNFQSVFKIIQRYSSISRRELQNLCSLSWGSISAITADMLANQLILEKSHRLGYSGRTPKLLTINSQKNRILGIDINVSSLNFALCDLAGQVLQSETILPKLLNKDEILSVIDEYTSKYFTYYDDIIMIAFSVQGQLNQDCSVSLNIDKIDGWRDVPLKSMYSKKFGVPVYLYHDPDCLLIHTLTKMRNFTEVKHCIELRLSAEGIGIAAMLNGAIYRGNGGIEIEHVVVAPNGLKCKCGKQGCLYAYCTLEGMQKQYKGVTESEFLSLVQRDTPDETILRLFKNYAYYLAVTIQNLFLLFNPEYVFMNGIMTEYKSLFEKELYLKIHEKYHSRVFINTYNPEYPAIGAALSAVDENLNAILFPRKP